MSKQSKIFSTHNYFGICLHNKPKSQNCLPDSAQKGKSFYQSQEFDKSRDQVKKKSQFYLEYRQKQQKNGLIQFYRMKSFVTPITHLKVENLRNFKVIGTFDNKIIVGFNQNLNLFCYFDQHAMHQRIRYEFYLEYLQNYGVQNPKIRDWDYTSIQKTQRLSNYMSYKITSEMDYQIPESINVQRYGFQVQYFKQEKVLKILKIPDILEKTFDNQLILNIAHDLILQVPKLPKCFESIIAEISCKSAYKFNDVLDIETINKLIKNLSLCQYPFFCVHGRPTLFTKG